MCVPGCFSVMRSVCVCVSDGGIFGPLLQEFTERTYYNQNWMNTLPMEM